MRLFKGEMSLWKQLTNDKLLFGPGGLSDLATYKASIGALTVAFVAYFFFWNIDAMHANFGEWLKHPQTWVFTVPGQVLTPDMRRHHFYAKFWLYLGLFLAGISFRDVWRARRRARKSAKGQWYDNPGLTKEDLYGKPRQRREDDES